MTLYLIVFVVVIIIELIIIFVLNHLNRKDKRSISTYKKLIGTLYKKVEILSRLTPEELASYDNCVHQDEPRNCYKELIPRAFSRSIDYKFGVGDAAFGLRPSVNVSASICANCGYPRGKHKLLVCPTGVVYNTTDNSVLHRFRSHKAKSIKSVKEVMDQHFRLYK